jgi:trehalose 2-sulfotransferase
MEAAGPVTPDPEVMSADPEDPADPVVAPRSSYLICATPRTGSYLLCDLLTATGLAGRPNEYLLPGYREMLTGKWGTSTYREYHDRTLAADTTPNGIFGTKIHGAQMLEFLRLATGQPWTRYEDRGAVFEEWFPNPVYIWIRRRDRVAQGVSWVRARQTNIWWDSDIDPAPPLEAPSPESIRFDFGAIDRAMQLLIDWDGEWRTYFDALGLDPLTVWYEDLLSNPRACVARVLDAIGLPGGPEPSQEYGFRRQADEFSVVWTDRFNRLAAARLESTISALAGLHDRETVYVLGATDSSARVPVDAITISVDPVPSTLASRASFALLTKPSPTPAADVVVTNGRFRVDHPFVVRFRTDPGVDPGLSSNALIAPSECEPFELARAFARHLGATKVEMVAA